MRTIEKPFRDIQKKNPNWSDYVCLIEAVRGRNFSRRTIREFFLKYVDPDDYDKSDQKALIDQLHIASNLVEDDHFETKISLLGVESLRGDRCVTSA